LADDLVAALAAAKDPQDQVDLLLRLGRRGGDDAFYAVRPFATAEDPNVRAAAYQSLGRLLERDPARLEPHVRWGIADANPHVRRRVVLAAAGARGLALRPLLEPLSGDPDPQVRRIVHRILRTQDPLQRAS
jgi:HEAT repeat protein